MFKKLSDLTPEQVHAVKCAKAATAGLLLVADDIIGDAAGTFSVFLVFLLLGKIHFLVPVAAILLWLLLVGVRRKKLEEMYEYGQDLDINASEKDSIGKEDVK